MAKENKNLSNAVFGSEGQYYTLFCDNTAVMLIIDPSTGNIVDANQAACKFYGYTFKVLTSMKMQDINILSDEQVLAEMKKAKKKEQNYFLFEHRIANGTIKPVEVYSGEITIQDKSLLFSIVHDITERKLAEEELYRSRNQLKSYMDNSPMAIVECDSDFIVTRWTGASEKIFGWKSEEVVGKNILDLNMIYEPDIQIVEEATKKIKSGLFTQVLSCNRNYKKGGNVIACEWYNIVLNDENGKMLSVLSEILDITERKKAKEKLLLLNKAIESTSDAIAITDAQGRQFYHNKSFTDLFGYKTAEEFETAGGIQNILNISEIITEDIVTLSSKSWSGELEMVTKSGHVFPAYQRSDAIKDSDDNIIGLIGVTTDITRLKKAEEALQESEEKYSKAFQSSPYAIAITNVEDGKFIEVNNAFTSVTGYSKEEVIGKTTVGLNVWVNTVDRDWVFATLLHGENIAAKEFLFRRKDGIINTALYYAKNIRFKSKPCIITSLYDITERKISEEALKKSEKEFRDIYDNAIEGMFRISIEGDCLKSNTAVATMLGYKSAADFVKTVKCFGIQIWLNSEERLKYVETLEKQGIIRGYECQFKRKNGEIIWVSLNSRVVCDKSGKSLYYEGFLEDISKRKQTELELINAKEKAEESDRLKTAFLHNMSHEVRTPLNAIVGFSQILVEPNQSAEQLNAFSDMISQSSDKLIEIITDVIEISKIQSNQIETKLTQIDIILFITNVVNSFNEKAKGKNITLIYNQNIPDNAYLIFSDKEKLKKIFSHIIDNAIKFTHKGSVDITCEIQQDSLKVLISDTGIGISDETQKIIFEPFRQLENELHRNYGGNGLGLPIVKAYTELLNGSISLKSEINKGTTVILTIPINKSGVEPSKNLINETNCFKLVFGTDYPVSTILIAEDDQNNFQYLSELLKPLNLEILHAINGQQAIDFCRNNNVIDLILMDIRMPIMDGHTAAKLIKAFRPNLPIIAQTAYATENEKNKYLNIFDDYITKPINKDEFKQKIMKYFDK